MPTLADLFKTCYLTGGSGVDFSAIRLHYRGVDEVCRAFGATALTVGSDIYFRQEAFAPHTPEGLRRTSATRILASAVCRRFGVPSPDIEALRNG